MRDVSAQRDCSQEGEGTKSVVKNVPRHEK